MKIVVVGANGYLGADLVSIAQKAGHEVRGTSRKPGSTEQARFDISDRHTWGEIRDYSPDALIWASKPSDDPDSPKQIAAFAEQVGDTRFVYMSSDVVLCAKTRKVASKLGDYARQKYQEQLALQELPNTSIIVVGPIYGENAQGIIDSRSQHLVENAGEAQQYWDNVFKTFVAVKGLARTIIVNLDKTGLYFAGPPTAQSYYEFYNGRAAELGLTTEITASQADMAMLEEQGICKDTSYDTEPNRLWID